MMVGVFHSPRVSDWSLLIINQIVTIFGPNSGLKRSLSLIATGLG
jgi:hypothetical protein